MKRSTLLLFGFCILAVSTAALFGFAHEAHAIVPTWDVGLNGPLNPAASIPIVGGVGLPGLTAPPGWFYTKEAGPVIANPLAALQGTFTSSLSLDGIMWWLSKFILHQFTQGVIHWIRTGQDPFFAHGTEGSLFVTNIDQFVLGAADNAAGVFLSNYLGPETYNQLCRPFRLNIAQLLGNSFGGRDVGSFRFKARCTVTDIVANLEDFYTDFDNGGWAAWMATANYENNPLGFSILATEHSRELQNRAATANHSDFLAGLGFPGLRECVKTRLKKNPDGTLVPPKADGTLQLDCEPNGYITKSPGKFVEDELSQATGQEIGKLGAADEINELVSTIFSSLLTWLVSGGGGSQGLLGAPIGGNQDTQGNICGANNRGQGCGCTSNAQCASNACFQGICLAATPINGLCGSANGVPTATPPTSGLCKSGTSTSVTQSGSSWVWQCTGISGGTTASCSAPHL